MNTYGNAKKLNLVSFDIVSLVRHGFGMCTTRLFAPKCAAKSSKSARFEMKSSPTGHVSTMVSNVKIDKNTLLAVIFNGKNIPTIYVNKQKIMLFLFEF